MKRFFKKSYSWLATLFLAVAFAVSGSAAAQGIELPFAFTTTAGGTVDGVGFYMWSADWSSSTELYGSGDAKATWGTVNLNSPAKNIVKVELTCRTNSWSSVGSAAAAAATVCETEDLGGTFTTDGAVAIWQGSAHKLTFSSTDDIDVYKIVVYLEEGEVVKECTVGVDHYADNCKPGKHEGSLSKYITLYMQENTATTSYTGSDNCPAEVTFTNEAGQQLPIAQFNYWQNNNQIGVNLKEEITTPGVYTLHIPEGLVAFESGKWNKEINATWTVVEPDNRPTKEVVFDFTDGTYTNDGTTSYTKEGVGLVLNENRWNAQAKGFRIATDGWLTFTAPEKASLKNIQLLQESSYGVNVDFSANVGEISGYEKTLNWAGDNASVTLTDNYGTCYFTKAIVTLAVEEVEVDPNEACFDAWKGLINGQFADIAYEYGYQVPEQDVPGKKPAAVVAPCVEYWSNRTAFVQLGFDWKTINDYLGQLYQTTIVEDYAYAQALLEAYNAAEVVPEVVEPVQKDKYTIKLNGTDYYFTTTEVKDNSVTTYSISATPEYFYIEPNGNGYTIQSADTEKWVGYDVINSWDFSNDEKVWTIGNLEGEPTYIYKNGSKGFGVDGSFEGAGVYTDKSGQYWVVEKFVEGGEVVDPVDPVEPTDLSIFAGEWFFKGEGAYCNSPENIDGSLNPKSEYTVNISVENGEIYMTGLIGDVYDYPYAYVGTYDAKAGTLSFDIEEGYYGKYIIDTNWEYYIMTDALVFKVEEAEDGIITLVNDGWDFLYEDWYYSQYACGFTSCVMTREQQIVEPEPEGWNGNVLLAESANDLDDLLTFTVEFEEAKEVKAAGQDILGAVFDVNGNPYAIVLANGIFDVFGSVSFAGSKATVEFVKIADLNAELQASAAASVKRIGGFTQVPGEATVVFCGKSFVVDGNLVYDSISKSYAVGGNGTPTSIESIATSGSNNAIYDLSGRRVVNAQGGLYIKEGRKVYMK